MLKEIKNGVSNIQTFFRLVEQLIPLPESKINDQPGNLQWTRFWCYGQTGDEVKVHPLEINIEFHPPNFNVDFWRMNFDFISSLPVAPESSPLEVSWLVINLRFGQWNQLFNESEEGLNVASTIFLFL